MTHSERIFTRARLELDCKDWVRAVETATDAFSLAFARRALEETDRELKGLCDA